MQDITKFYLQVSKEVASRKKTALVNDLKKLAGNPLLGSKDDRLGDEYQYWYALGLEYRVYFKRLGPNSIKVLRVWPSRKPPLEPTEITG